jgi:hypothetical protein
MSVFEQDEEVELRLSWPKICRLACMAMIYGVTFDEICAIALRDYMARGDRNERS